MARRGRRKKGRKGKRAFPILAAVPVIPGLYAVYNARASGPANMVRQGVQTISGVDITGQLPWNQAMATKTLGLAVIGLVGHKIANKVGVNKHLRKLSMGYIEL